MDLRVSRITAKADALVRRFHTRDPELIARGLGITIIECGFVRQKGVYKTVIGNPFIFISRNLTPQMRGIVLSHELGHHCLHRPLAADTGFREFNLFDMGQSRLEYEANVFASQLMLPDDEVLEHIARGLDIHQTASAMDSDINLVALKVDTLIARGLPLRRQDHESRFLR